ncbi:DUF7426 family protein [Nocardia salmonicida]|uniref:DUF7426 family protein n=1 Tax=Nocardia salmonicida TaxID=53431 RepID=UPI0036398680
MAGLRDLTEFYDPDLQLPISGVTYRVRSPGIVEADRLRGLVLDDLAPADEYREIVQILGTARDEMAANGVPDAMAMHAGRTALLHFGASPELGRYHWQLAQLGQILDAEELLAASAPPAPRPNRAARRKPRRRRKSTKSGATDRGTVPTD